MTQADAAGKTPQLDYLKLKEHLAETFTAALARVSASAGEVLQAYANDIARDVALSAAAGRKDFLRNLEDQAMLLGEVHRIHLDQAGWDLFLAVLNAVAEALGAFLVSLVV